MATRSPLASKPPIRSLAATPQARIARPPVPNGRRNTLQSVGDTRQGRMDCFFGGVRALAGCSTQTAPYNRGPVATIQPFRALRPRPEQAAAVAAVPYDVVR